MQGYIKLFRQIIDNELWLIKPFSEGQAWIDLLLITTFDKGLIKIKNGELLELKKGECGYSQLTLSNRWGWSRGKVLRFLTFLETQKMIQQKKHGNFTIINILNFDKFQSDTTNDTTNGQQTDTIKNVNNVNNDNNIINIREHFKKPTIEEIKKYCVERNNSINAQSFYDYYESIGWKRGKTKMKDWKAAVRTWEQNEKKYNKPDKPDRENGWEL